MLTVVVGGFQVGHGCVTPRNTARKRFSTRALTWGVPALFFHVCEKKGIGEKECQEIRLDKTRSQQQSKLASVRKTSRGKLPDTVTSRPRSGQVMPVLVAAGQVPAESVWDRHDDLSITFFCTSSGRKIVSSASTTTSHFCAQHFRTSSPSSSKSQSAFQNAQHIAPSRTFII